MLKHPAQSASARRGFTLMEALVAVIGIAILAVGIATVFSSISKTVKAGRRISAINGYAAVMERVLREDFTNMTREGFFVIRNEFALNRDGVPLSREALGTARPRRIDEVVFFVRGRHESARAPLDPNYTTRAGVARVYYGHGEKMLEGTTGFSTPFLDEANDEPSLRLGVSDGTQFGIGDANPNFYAGDWTLLRHVTLLKTPEPFPANTRPPLGVPPGNIQKYADNNLQIDAQPAAAGIFRSETLIGRPVDNPSLTAGGDSSFADYSLRSEESSPLFESGLVDIATTTLSEIKNRVTTLFGIQSNLGPGGTLRVYDPTPTDVVTNEDLLPNFNANSNTLFRLGPRDLADYRQDLIDSNGGSFPAPSGTPFPSRGGLQTLVEIQHAWMADALPGRSNELEWSGTYAFTSDPVVSTKWRGFQFRTLANNGSARTRMRYETTPPGYNADVFGPDAAALGPVLQAAYRADQQVIDASQFIPRCTEFIVEYSFGEADPVTNETIWYGHDADAKIATDRAGAVRWLRPEADRPTVVSTPQDQRLLEQHLRADLINGMVTENGSRDGRRIKGSPLRFPLTHYFGYADPRAVRVFDKDLDGDGIADPNDGFDLNDDGIRDDIDGDGIYDDSWPWPKMVRITMSFADPLDQTIEETFQFVIEIPGESGI